MGTRIVVDMSASKIEVEGPASFVRKELSALLALIAAPHTELPAQRESRRSSRAIGRGSERLSLRRFAEAKAPGNTYEQMAVVLHYAENHEERPESSTNEILAAMGAAGFRRPKAPAQAVSDARRRYGYLQPGSKRGLWKLSQQGTLLVEDDLPRAAPK